MTPSRALRWVALWVAFALVATYVIWRVYGRTHGLEFVTCYVIEWSLSVDNLFVFLMIFKSFGVDSHRQLRTLNWGIIGAVVLRLLFILVGVALVNLFEPIMYLFGAILLYSAYKMAFSGDEEMDVKDNVVVKYVQKRVPMTPDFVGDRFFTRTGAGFLATPMLLVLVAVNVSDVVFAVDSVPAAFAITRNPWTIFSANVFAILGLRSIYFVLAHAERAFWLLKYGVAVVLAFIGIKMLAAHWIHIEAGTSLIVVIGSLAAGILLSIVIKEPDSGSSN